MIYGKQSATETAVDAAEAKARTEAEFKVRYEKMRVVHNQIIAQVAGIEFTARTALAWLNSNDAWELFGEMVGGSGRVEELIKRIRPYLDRIDAELKNGHEAK